MWIYISNSLTSRVLFNAFVVFENVELTRMMAVRIMIHVSIVELKKLHFDVTY